MWWHVFTLFPLILSAEISALYLSWYDDPTSTMTIQWHSSESEFGDTVHLQNFDDAWHPFNGEHVRVDDLLIHTVTLKNLDPDTAYAFRIGDDPEVYRFRTAPVALEEPLQFCIGGDVYQNIKRFRKMCETIVKHDPRFVVLGGDIAYALTIHPFRSSELRRWRSFFKNWKELMVSPDGYLIPFLIAPGNHDITPDNYELFFNLFAFPKKQLYRTVDFGDYLTLFMLDTGHFQPVEGRQTLWLDKALQSHIGTPYRFAVYHVAAYPSYYPYHGIVPKKIRANWVPLFEKYGISASFENHNHAYKRTYPIKENQVNSTGIVYLGDGGWGASPRRTKDLWYLSKRERKSTAFVITLTPKQATVRAVDFLNNEIDKIKFYPINK